jgi:hypothetical protein
MWPAVGGAQIELTIGVRRTSEDKEATAYQISATMSIGRNASQQRHLLTSLTANTPVNPVQVSTDFRVTGFIGSEQLRVVEELRSGTDALWVFLDISAIYVSGDPAGLVGRSGSLDFPIMHSEWLTELERVDVGSYLEILVPLTANPEHANAVRRLRAARALLQEDRPEQVLSEVRKALEPIRRAEATQKIVQQAKNKAPRDRDQHERWAFFIEDTFSLLSGAAHDDAGTTEHFTWTHADAAALVTTVGGLLRRLAERTQP